MEEPQPIIDPMQAQTFDVQLPDGKVLRGIPTGTSRDEIVQRLGYDPDSKESSLASRSKEDFEKRQKQFHDIGQNGETGAERALQGVGVYAGGLGDVVGNLIGSGARTVNYLTRGYAGEGLKAVGDAAMNTETGQNFKKGAGYLGDAAMNTETGQNFKKGAGYLLDQGQQLAKEYPRAADDLGAAANVAGLIPVAKMGAGAGNIVADAGEGLVNMGAKQTTKRQAGFAKDLVMPKESKKVLEDQVDRTTEQGVFRKKVVEPSKAEQASIDAVSGVASKGKSFQANYNAINQAKNQEAEALLNFLKQNDVSISDDSLINALSDVRNNLGKNPYVTGNGAGAAESIVNNALDIIQKHPQTASGLLQARKEFDSFVLSQKPKVFDAVAEAPVTAAVREVRQSINNLIDQAVPNASVKQSLAKQSAMYDALDNIAPKAAGEGKNVVSRAIRTVSDKIPIKNGIVKQVAEAGLLGGGALAAINAPAVVGGGLATAAALKAVTGPTAKKVLGNIIKATGQTISPGQLSKMKPAEALLLLNQLRNNQ